LTHLKEINSSDQNGTESFIYEKVFEGDGEDISWLPLGRTRSIKLSTVEEEQSVEGLFESFLKKMQMITRFEFGDNTGFEEIISFIEKMELEGKN